MMTMWSRLRWFSFILLLFFNLSHGNDICDRLNELNKSNISEKCLKQMSTVCKTPDLQWKLFDASGKFSFSGLSYSTVYDVGDFPECLSIQHTEGDEIIKGKYCFAGIVIPNVFPKFNNTAYEVEEMEREVLKSLEQKTPPKISTKADTLDSMGIIRSLIKISLCVPDACTPKEVGDFYLYGHLSEIKPGPIIIYPGDLIPCESEDSNTEFEAGDITVIVLLGSLALIMIISTIYDYMITNRQLKPKHSIFIAFSILTNGKKLLHINEESKEQISTFNGMRFISTCWVISFHAVGAYQFGAFSIINWPDVDKWNSTWTNRYILSALLAVDTFIFIAGFVWSYSYFKTSTKKSSQELIKEVPTNYLHRYLRITPAIGAMFLFLITLYRFLGTGPAWTLLTTEMRDTCKSMWWKFFLYIQNYSDPDGMCVNPSWYLSADIQMYILSPLVLIPTAMFIEKRFKQTMLGLMGLTILAIIIPPVVRYTSGEIGNIYTAHERFNNYVIGITFGAYMRFRKDEPFIFSAGMNIFLWVASIIISLAFNIYWFDVRTDPTLLKYTLFMGLYRPVWCVCLVFMVYSCYHGQGGVVNWFLSLPRFQILAKLSYSMYVVHFLVLSYFIGTLKTPLYFSDYMLFYQFCGHLIVTMMVAIVWVLAFEMPMITIEKILRNLLSGKGNSVKKTTE